MAIYEYDCRACGNRFDLLVRHDTEPACPSCESKDLEKLLSLPAVKSETTRGLAMRAAKKRDKRQAKDNMMEQLRYEQSHDRHG